MIKAAAIRYPQGDILTARRHYLIIAKAAGYGVKTGGDCIQGFVTTTGKFVDRRQAMQIAKTLGQMPKDHKKPELYSEDLWTTEEVSQHVDA